VDEELKNWSQEVKIKAGWVCNCGELDKTLLDAHHKKPKSTHPELALDVDNGECICLWGHAVEHRNDRRICEHLLARLACIIFPRFFPETVKKHGQITIL